MLSPIQSVHPSFINEYTNEIELPWEDSQSQEQFEGFLRNVTVENDEDLWGSVPKEVTIGRCIRTLLPKPFTMLGCGFTHDAHGVIMNRQILNVIISKAVQPAMPCHVQLFKLNFEKVCRVLKSAKCKEAFVSLVEKMIVKIQNDEKKLSSKPTTKLTEVEVKIEKVTDQKTEALPKEKRKAGRPPWKHLMQTWDAELYKRLTSNGE